MNRSDEEVFHSLVQSRFALAVNAMWKLCKAGQKSEGMPDYTGASEAFGTDF